MVNWYFLFLNSELDLAWTHQTCGVNLNGEVAPLGKISEFDKTNLEKEYKEGCKAPFVKGSPVQLICKYQNEYNIKENGTILVVASIEDIYFNEELVSDSGFLQLDKGGVVTVNGCDGYALPSFLDRFEYQRPKK